GRWHRGREVPARPPGRRARRTDVPHRGEIPAGARRRAVAGEAGRRGTGEHPGPGSSPRALVHACAARAGGNDSHAAALRLEHVRLRGLTTRRDVSPEGGDTAMTITRMLASIEGHA